MTGPSSQQASDGFTAVRIEGGVLSPEILARIAAGDRDLPGITPGEYGVPTGRLGDAVSRSWAYLQGLYPAYRDQLAALPASDRGTTLTRKKWLLPLFAELGYGQLQTTRGLTADGRSFPVSHLHREHFPLHLLSWHTKLDRHPAAGGRVPQAMFQDCLNSHGNLLWGALSNGRTLRLVRDSTSLVGSAYVEFDLESIFDGDLYPDFFLLYALLHATRVELTPRPGNEEVEADRLTAADCWLERWRTEAIDSGSRFLRGLSNGLQQAVQELGTGFLSHPGRSGPEPTPNERLRQGLRSGEIDKTRFNDALLRLVYRLIFLFVAEDRQALFSSDADATARQRYEDYFSTARLRRLALSMKGDRGEDLWESLRMVLRALGEVGGDPRLCLSGLGGVYDPGPQDLLADDLPLADLDLPNDRLLAAVRHLARVRSEDGSRWLPVDYRHMGAEELGGVYEWLLALDPDPDPGRGVYRFRDSAGHSRKTSGSYYTPSSLVDTLLESALDPVLDEAAAQLDPVRALLDVTVCDPACGSGHFLVAAARRIAKRIAAVHTQEAEPPVAEVERWMPDVIARCIHGVDLNPMAVDLAKFALWMQALVPNEPRPMSFLDAHIRHGNALLGVTPAMLEKRIPDEAYAALEGDDRKQVARLRKRNREERDHGLEALFTTGDYAVPTGNAHHAHVIAAIHRRRGHQLGLEHIRDQMAQYRAWQSSPGKVKDRRIADARCAVFVWPTHEGGPEGITTDTMRRYVEHGTAGETTDAEVDRIAAEYGFFHWHLEFPHIFPTSDHDVPDFNPGLGWSGGFSCVLGNPPWDRVKLQDKEFFATRIPEIATAPSKAARDRLIAELAKDEDRSFFYDAYLAARRRSEGQLHLLRHSERFPFTGQGDVNTYAVFAETAQQLTGDHGRMGVIVPTGIAVDATTAKFFKNILSERRLDSLLDFVTNPRIWSGVGHNRFRFSLLTLTGRRTTQRQSESWTLAKHPDELPPRGSRMRVNPHDLLLVNPNTGTMPMFRAQQDADITLGIYRRVPVLWREPDEQGEREDNPWGMSFLRMFDMANDSDMFWEREELEAGGLRLEGNVFTGARHPLLPLYEAKFVHHYDHRLSCYSKRPEGSQDTELPRLTLEEKNDPWRGPIPRYWMSGCDVDHRLEGKWDREWLLGWRDITRSTDERTLIADVIPRMAVNDKFLLAMPSHGSAAALLACLSSFACDYIARQKVSGVSMKYFAMKQLAVLPPDTFDEMPWAPGEGVTWLTPRVLELTYTAHDLAPFARDLGDEGQPFRWDEERRAVIRAELDAVMFHLYGLTEEEADYIMETFPIVRGKDIAAHGEYRTKRLILEAYRALAKAAGTGEQYVSSLVPPPGRGPRHA